MGGRGWGSRRQARRPLGPSVLAGLALVVAAALPVTCEGSDDPAADLGRALSLGPPGLLWGRLAVEEESPDGAWTSLVGIDVVLYPHLPGILVELERIRDSARTTGRQYESAVTRLQEALRVYKTQIETMNRQGSRGAVPPGPPASPGAPAGVSSPGGSGAKPEVGEGVVRRRVTGEAGVFVFDQLPSGEWLLVATRVIAYQAPPGRAEGRPEDRRAAQLRQRFTPRTATGPAKAAEVWVTRVSVPAGERTRLMLTDRTRWMVGPVR